jgi:hypothetical protein
MASEGIEIKTLYRVEGLESCKTGSVATYTLLPEDEFGKPKDVDLSYLKVYLRGPSSFEGTMKRALQGQYTLAFRPEDPGHYWLDVQYDGAPIFKQGDITLDVSLHSPRVRAKLNFEFDGPGLHAARVGERTELVIITKDEHGKEVDIDVAGLDVRVKGPANTNVKANCHREKSARYVARYEVNVPGEFVMTVSYDDRKVLDQKVTFSDVTRGEKSAILNSPSSARVREAAKVRIQSKDMFGNNVLCGGDQWSAVSTGPSTASIQITDNLDGTYLAELIFPKAGVYHIDFKLLGVSAQGSPIKLTCQ